METNSLKGRSKRGTIAVGAIAIIAIFMITLSCIAVAVMEYSRFAYSVKTANEAVAAKAKENLTVQASISGRDTAITVTNVGSTPSLIVAVFAVNSEDKKLEYYKLDTPIACGILGEKAFTVKHPIPENWQIGVLTSLGNVFWETEEQPPPGPLPGPWLEGWRYRAAVIIDNTHNSQTLTDYQVLVKVDTASLVSAGKMRPDCGDMRFTDSDAMTLISYWIEPGTENTANTKIWVKVPSILGSSTKTIYMYYGNPTASSASNGSETFVFFDDFSGGSLDTTKWSVTEYVDTSQYYEVRNGELHVYAYSTRNPSGYKFTTKSSFNLDSFALHMKGRWTNLDYVRGGGPILTVYLIDADNQLTALDTRLRGDWYVTVWKWTDGNWRDVSRSRNAIPDRSSGNAVYEYKVVKPTFNMKLSGTYTISHNPTITTFTLPFKIQLATWLDYWTNPVRTHSYYDLVYLRAYTSPEPTVILGTEETL